MNAVERVQERLQRAMEGLLREFAADGTELVDCEFIVHVGSQGLIDVSGGELKSAADPLVGTPLDEWPSSEGLPEKPKVTKKKS